MDRARAGLRGVLLVLLSAAVFGCGEDSTELDLFPPAVVEDLHAFAQDSTSILLTWTAPGDDGDQGQAAGYNLRSSMDLGDPWEEMLPVEGVPTPATPGSPDSFLVGGLPAMETFHFRLSTRDEAFNWSEVSEPVSATTLQGIDRTPPGPVDDLVVARVEPRRILLIWRAPGDDGFRGRAWSYDVRYWTPDVPSWEEAEPVVGEPSPGRANQPDSVWVDGLEPNSEYLFGLRSRDEVENWSSISNIVTETTAYLEDLQWADGFALPPAGQGIVESVYALMEYDGALIAAGHFNRAGETWARNIARWNGESWSPLGDGTNGQIKDMTIHEGDLIVSGSFTSAGRIAARGIARWNGSVWSAFGDGVEDGPVVVWNGDLIAQIGESPDALGRWTGTGWAPLPDSPLYRVNDLEIFDGRLVACGVGATPDTETYVTSFDGSSWAPLLVRETGPMTEFLEANALFADGNQLFVGGTQDLALVQVWNGSNWSKLNSGLVTYGKDSDGIVGLGRYRGQIIALGYVSSVAGRYSPGVASWNGAAWEPLGSGLDLDEPWVEYGPIGRAAVEFDGSLYVGGGFDVAGRRASRNIARWEE